MRIIPLAHQPGHPKETEHHMIDHSSIIPGDFVAAIHRDLSSQAGLAALKGS